MFNFSNKVSNTIKRHAHLQTFGLLDQLSAQLQIIILYLLLSFYIPSLPTA